MKKRIFSDIDFIFNKLLETAVFKGASKNILYDELSRGGFDLVEYLPGETILSPDEGEKKIIVFISGKAEIFSADENRSVLLNTATEGSVIGVANIFTNEDFVSRLIAAKLCQTVEISADKFREIMEKDARILRNFTTFLSERIRYLNRKIVILTAGSAERRLAYFLEDNTDSDGKLTLQMNQLCEMLNLGRASLYRATDKLTEEGFILREGKCIKVLNMTEMMKKYG